MPTAGFMFATSVGSPLDLQVLAQRLIRPALAKVNMQWRGWHACRRGLATNLHRLGVQDKIIQRILRHSNVAVTQSCYIKTAAEDAVEAMNILERATVVQQQQQALGTVQ
jgi:integrase